MLDISRLITYSVSTFFNRINFYRKRIFIGDNSTLLGQIQVYNFGNISIGSSFTLVSKSSYNPLCLNLETVLRTEISARMIIGNNVGISSSIIWAFKEITIGNHVNIGAGCIVMDSDAHALKAEDRISNDIKCRVVKPIFIGNNVFIGTRSLILKGVSIGDNSVIGAGSVVTKSIPANCIAAGNPCKVIRYL